MDPRFAKIGDTPTRVIEECSELVQALSKARRFGLFSSHPETGQINIDTILSEMEDVETVMEELRGDLMTAIMEKIAEEGGING